MNKKDPRADFVPATESGTGNISAESLFKKQRDAATLVDYLAGLDVDSTRRYVRMSPIICSIGSASRDLVTLERLLVAGMDVAKLNFSYGTHAYHAQTLANIRKAVDEHSRKLGRLFPLGIAIDLKGPKIHTGIFEGGELAQVELKKGTMVKLTTEKAFAVKSTVEHIFVDYPGITKAVKVGSKVFLDHGQIRLAIVDLGLSFLTCVVESGGLISSRKAVELPGSSLDLPALTTKDRVDLRFASEHGVDMIFAPFVRNPATINEIRYLLGEKGKKILIISRVESRQGVHRIDEIIQVSDGIIVSRAELTMSIRSENVVTAQMTTIARCNLTGRPVICDSQVLESMTRRARVALNEATDVANTILNGVDCVMLAGPTETGLYPVESVRKMVDICQQAEAALWMQQRNTEMVSMTDASVDARDVVAMATVRASMMCRAAAIIAITKSGASAHSVSKYRPRCPIIAVTRYLEVARRHQIYRGIIPVIYRDKPHPDWQKDIDVRAKFGLQVGLDQGFIKIGDHVIIVSGWKRGSLFTNTTRILHVTAARALEDVWNVTT